MMLPIEQQRRHMINVFINHKYFISVLNHFFSINKIFLDKHFNTCILYVESHIIARNVWWTAKIIIIAFLTVCFSKQERHRGYCFFVIVVNNVYPFHLVGRLVGCFGLIGPLIDERKNVQTTPTAPTASAVALCPTIIHLSRPPRHWKFTQYHHTTRPPPTHSV